MKRGDEKTREGNEASAGVERPEGMPNDGGGWGIRETAWEEGARTDLNPPKGETPQENGGGGGGGGQGR